MGRDSPDGVVLDQVPSRLRGLAQWVCWKLVLRHGKQTKCPIDPRTGRPASATGPETWATFNDAISAWQADDEIEGPGFVFTDNDPFVGVDLDGCIDERGDISAGAREIIDALSSYTEISPSGRGVKIFIAAQKPGGSRCRTRAVEGFDQLEVYSTERFFTVTGRHLTGTPTDIQDRQVELDALCHRLWPKPSRAAAQRSEPSPGVDGDDGVLIERARAAKNGGRFRRLWEGDTSLHGGDQSAADQALCNLLAFWTGHDPERIDRLFRRSGLYRDKWDERRGDRTYGAMTIEHALEQCTETYSPAGRTAKALAAPQPDGSAGSGPVLGRREPETGRLVLSERRTLPTAEAFVRAFHEHPEGPTLYGFAGKFLEWRDNRFAEVEAAALRHRVQPWLHASLRLDTKRNGELELSDFNSNPGTVTSAIETIRAFTHIAATTPIPSWLDDRAGRPPALEILTCLTKNLHIPTGRVLPATPALFTTNALEFDYEPDPEPPERWANFLEQLFGGDLESVGLLQEWFGYCLTADTSQQKMLLVVGPRRSGKGTIGRVLANLIGKGNVVGPTISSLARGFGMQPLIGKSLAIVSDARFTGECVGTVVERLLCISGEDTLSIDRKYLGAVNMKLPTRFVFLTNELPRFRDSGAALAGRFLVLRLQRSFYGHEDPALTSQLLAELPGILAWSLDGWKRLHQRGRFIQPSSAEDAIRDLEELASPVSAFVRERCIVGAGYRVPVDDLYREWREWCERDGRARPSNKATFGRDLSAAVPGVRRRRGTGMTPFYEGIGLAGRAP